MPAPSSPHRRRCPEHSCSRSTDLVPTEPPQSPRWWSSLHKLAVCCPGLLHAGVLVDPSDRPPPPLFCRANRQPPSSVLPCHMQAAALGQTAAMGQLLVWFWSCFQSGVKVYVGVDKVAELGSMEEERCLWKLKELRITERVSSRSDH